MQPFWRNIVFALTVCGCAAQTHVSAAPVTGDDGGEPETPPDARPPAHKDAATAVAVDGASMTAAVDAAPPEADAAPPHDTASVEHGPPPPASAACGTGAQKV